MGWRSLFAITIHMKISLLLHIVLMFHFDMQGNSTCGFWESGGSLDSISFGILRSRWIIGGKRECICFFAVARRWCGGLERLDIMLGVLTIV